eukprot:g3688.t1
MTLAYGYNAATPLRSDEEKDRQREILHKRYAPEMLRIILDMRGYYIKATQMMVGAGMLPDAYEEHLKVLLDEVPARPLEVVKGILEAELGCPTEEVFESFSDTPIGAASIGQVHLAKIKGSGTPVVVKIQYPEVEAFFHLDMLTIKNFCVASGQFKNVDKMFDEAAKSFEAEFDYRLEGQNLRECADNLQASRFRSRAYIPLPVDAAHPACPTSRRGGGGEGLCTRKVLTMEAVQGVPIKKRMKQVFADMAKAQGKTAAALVAEMEAEFSDPGKLREFMNRPPPSPTAVYLGLCYLSLRDYVRNAAAWTYNHTVGLGGVVGAPIAYEWSAVPPNGPAITRLLYDIHGHQVFEDGQFNADPHAGNVMLCDDDAADRGGQVALIDYGNAPKLTLEERLDIARFIVALDDGDEARIVAMYKKMGFRGTGDRWDDLVLLSAYGDFDQQWGKAWLNRRFGMPEDAGLTELGEKAMKWGTPEEFPASLINLQRCLMTLNGVATATGGGNPRPSTMWRNAADKLLARHGGGGGGK